MTFDEALDRYHDARTKLRALKSEWDTKKREREVLDKELSRLDHQVKVAAKGLAEATEALYPELAKEFSSDVGQALRTDGEAEDTKTKAEEKKI